MVPPPCLHARLLGEHDTYSVGSKGRFQQQQVLGADDQEEVDVSTLVEELRRDRPLQEVLPTHLIINDHKAAVVGIFHESLCLKIVCAFQFLFIQLVFDQHWVNEIGIRVIEFLGSREDRCVAKLVPVSMHDVEDNRGLPRPAWPCHN